MKLEMKKIALVMAAGIFALSGAFGALGGLSNKASNARDLQNLEVKNELSNSDVEVIVTKNKEGPSMVTVNPKQEEHIAFFPAISGGIKLAIAVKKKANASEITTGPTQQEQKIDLQFTGEEDAKEILAAIKGKLQSIKSPNVGAIKITPTLSADESTLLISVTQGGVQQGGQQ